MTIARHDQHSTEFGLWLRGRLQKKINPEPICWEPEVIQQTDVSSINSLLQYNATNLDYIWSEQCRFILLEEKRYCSEIRYAQSRAFAWMDRALLSSAESENYGGFYIITFERTNPEDGSMWLERFFPQAGRDSGKREIKIPEFMEFLKLGWIKTKHFWIF